MWMALQSNDKRAEHNFEGGLNTSKTSFDVRDDQYIEGFGWSSADHPTLTTRKGRTPYGSAGSGATRLLTGFGNNHLVRAVGGQLQYNPSGTTWTNIQSGFTNTDWDSANFDHEGPVLIMTNGQDDVQMWDGTNLSNLSSNAPKGKYIASDDRRVYIANANGDESPDIVHYCAFQDATDWTSPENSGSVQFYTPKGGAITGMISFGGQIWVFKRDAYCLIFHSGDSTFTHRLSRRSDSVGCASFKTIVPIGQFLFWMDENDVYMGVEGEHRVIGEPIRRFLDEINHDHIENCFASTDGIRYYLGLVTGDSIQPNIILSYDTRRDYRRWDIHSEMNGLRYGTFFNNRFYIGASNGQTSLMNEGTTDHSAPIPYRVVTKDFDEGDPEKEKEYYELYLQFKAPEGTTMTVEASVDQGGSWIQIGDPIQTGNTSQSTEIIVPLDLVPLAHYIRFRISGEGQFSLYKIQRYFRVQPVQH